ncbi:hypothetical protein CLCR_11388 [Cladophialophora carrionii]|uniref:Uncharacterized protein n=1 Tax=Cladophialophora carrionii TaxID=86049 RepID=A0A1C1CUA1_9EURO|nr:hypothetical protein CLCR_11388 [Cladophialophora carrionii]
MSAGTLPWGRFGGGDGLVMLPLSWELRQGPTQSPIGLAKRPPSSVPGGGSVADRDELRFVAMRWFCRFDCFESSARTWNVVAPCVYVYIYVYGYVRRA